MEPLFREVFEHDLIADFECNNFLGLNLELSKHLKLLEVEGAAIKDPAVEAAVRLAEPFIDQIDHVLIRNYTHYGVRRAI